jgi:hypothetical protein
MGLEAMRLALDYPLVVVENYGFLRPEAALSVVVVSDEDDGSPIPLNSYVAFLAGTKAGTLSNAQVMFSAVTGGANGCEVGDAAAYPAPRYESMVQAFGGISLSICDANWGEQLSQIGEATFSLQRVFTLSNEADPATVTVTVDGQTTTEFSLLPGEQTLQLDSDPPPGSVVEVTYLAPCASP